MKPAKWICAIVTSNFSTKGAVYTLHVCVRENEGARNYIDMCVHVFLPVQPFFISLFRIFRTPYIYIYRYYYQESPLFSPWWPYQDTYINELRSCLNFICIYIRVFFFFSFFFLVYIYIYTLNPYQKSLRSFFS